MTKKEKKKILKKFYKPTFYIIETKKEDEEKYLKYIKEHPEQQTFEEMLIIDF